MAGPEFATLTDDDLVTGEAVALDLPAASVGVRLVAGLIDVVVTVVLLGVVAVVAGIVAAGVDTALGDTISTLVVVLVLVVWPVTVETVTRGRSLGRLAMGTRVVRDDAGPISAQHALVRALVGVVEIYALFGVPAVLTMMLNRRGKRLGDLTAGTYVVRARVPLHLPSPAPMPPHLAGWAAAADISTLPTGLALAVRRFLARRWELQPFARQTVAVRLAEQVAPYVAPAAPPGTHPEDLLAAVVASRRDRDLARLGRDAALRDRLTRPR